MRWQRQRSKKRRSFPSTSEELCRHNRSSSRLSVHNTKNDMATTVISLPHTVYALTHTRKLEIESVATKPTQPAGNVESLNCQGGDITISYPMFSMCTFLHPQASTIPSFCASVPESFRRGRGGSYELRHN